MTLASNFSLLAAVAAVSIESPAFAQDFGAGYPRGYSRTSPATIHQPVAQSGYRILDEVPAVPTNQAARLSAAALGNQH